MMVISMVVSMGLDMNHYGVSGLVLITGISGHNCKSWGYPKIIRNGLKRQLGKAFMVLTYPYLRKAALSHCFRKLWD